MFAENGTYLQEAELAEPEFAESDYGGYAETEPYGEYYPSYQQPYYSTGQQPYYAQPSYSSSGYPGAMRTVWSPYENRHVSYRWGWSYLYNRWKWIRTTPRFDGGYPGSSPYAAQQAYPGMPGQPGYPSQPGQPGYPGMPGQPGMPGFQQMTGGRRRRRRRR